MMVLLISILFFEGMFIQRLISNEEIKLSNILVFSLPVSLVFNSIIFSILCAISIYYGKVLFIIIFLLLFGLFIYKSIKKGIKIVNDIKSIPIYYLIVVVYIGYKLIAMAATGFIEFYNYDEFTAYHFGSFTAYTRHDYWQFFDLFTPINYFAGTITFEFVGYSISMPRIFAAIFWIITSFGIYFQLTKNKTNRHIAALISMIMLISSSEMLQLSKTLYANIYYMFYFTFFVYLLIDYYIIQEKKNVPYLVIILAFGAALTRREGMYHAITVLLLFSLYLIFTKKIKLKNMIFLNCLIPMPFILKIISLMNNTGTSVVRKEALSIFEKISIKMEESNLNSFIENLKIQTINHDYYYMNYLLYFLLFITLIVIVILMFKKKKIDYKKIYKASVFIIICEIMYFSIVALTELLIFKVSEWQVAASTSRYLNQVLIINFVVLGNLLFYKTNNEEISNDKGRLYMLNKKSTNGKILIIIPAYNEEENILNTYNSIIEYNKKNQANYDVIVINDGSVDRTEDILVENNIPHIKLIHNLGIGGAVQTGYKYALKHDYDIAVQFDGDGQHDVNYVKDIVNPIIDGKSNMVIGSRFIVKSKDGFKSSQARRIGINIISFNIKMKTGQKIYDTTSGFRAIDRNIIEMFANTYPTEYPEPITTVRALKNDYKVLEIPVVMHERQGGKSSIGSWKNAYYMVNVILSILLTRKGVK